MDIKNIKNGNKVDSKKRNRKIKIISISGLVSLAAIIIFVVILNFSIIPKSRYNNALKLYEQEKYDEALEGFLKIEKFKDSRVYIDEINNIKIYNEALDLYNKGEYESAEIKFNEVKKFKESELYLNKIDQKYIMGFLTSDNFFYFGSYPQTVVDDEDLIIALDKLTSTNVNGYYEYNGSQYAKQSANPYNSYDKFSNGEEIVKRKEYYFKVEPIKWRIVEEYDGALTLLSEFILDQEKFYTSRDKRTINGETIYPNNYEHSTIRDFLNNEFYKKAFNSSNKKNIVKTFIDNSESTAQRIPEQYVGNNTNDNIFLLSYQEANSNYFANSNERGTTATDYAIAKKVFTSSKLGYWWLRSPYYKLGNHFVTRANIIYGKGGVLETEGLKDNVGVRPAVRVEIE